MQDNQITLPVDTANDGNPTNVVFTRHLEEANRSTYRGPTHTSMSRQLLQLYRSAAKRSGNSYGANKATLKYTIDHLVDGVDGNQVAEATIIEVTVRSPVGLTQAQQLADRQVVVSALDHDLMITLQDILEI